ncbi:class I SAM-dependent methyltransferase [Streptosporangium sp. NPDC000239]|uniref:class I SAM-dependent methyltransferase n=1 Tax=Streptosporangium sp. NPDC000239 TaxID=3154248 RepID=UPI0033254669
MEDDKAYTERHALSFGGVAQVYDDARPDYPDELFEYIAGRLPGPKVLEVGAGTGKATVGLVDQGLTVTAVEPDPRMAAILPSRAGGQVGVEVATFESFAAAGPYDGLVSAQAWHWTDPETRMDRAAALLRPGGFLGLVWNCGPLRQEEVVAAIRAIYDDFGLSDLERPAEPITGAEAEVIQDPETWPGDELDAHPGFEYLGSVLFPWQETLRAAEFGAYLRSTSYFQTLGPERGESLIGRITTVIHRDFDDLVTVDWTTQCYEAVRLG